MRRRRLLSLMAQALPVVAVVPWIGRKLVEGARRAAAPGSAWLATKRIVPLDEERIGPGDDLAG